MLLRLKLKPRKRRRSESLAVGVAVVTSLSGRDCVRSEGSGDVWVRPLGWVGDAL